MINELYSKLTANLQEIMDGDGNPSKEDILNSKDFQVNLVNDLISKKNISDWEIYDEHGSIADANSENDQFAIEYTFNFKYKYKETLLGLTLFINGEVDIDWVGGHAPETRYNPAEYPTPKVDDTNLGRSLDLALFDSDGSEISLTWLTPDLEKRVVKSIISPYL
jgi:hypothetical protein